jgi:hypothetical protein
MSEDKYVVTFDREQWLELEEIIMEDDRDAALMFLKQCVYDVIDKKQRKQLQRPV